MKMSPTQQSMKTIDMSSQSAAKAYLSRPPKETHTKEELEALHNAIRYTQMFKQEESLSRMDEEETIERPLPKMPKDVDRTIIY